jgi:hypothetical protein
VVYGGRERLIRFAQEEGNVRCRLGELIGTGGII